MVERFDPYKKWLNIPLKDQPPNHYRLLGVELFESDVEVIEVAAMDKTRFLREIQEGPHVPQAQRLLNEIAVARLCLLDAKKRNAYDAVLRQRIDRRRREIRRSEQHEGGAERDNLA